MRLGEEGRPLDADEFLVSIPAWCDWELTASEVLQLYNKFQFQLGAIGSVRARRRTHILHSFNSSLVRLGGNMRNYIAYLPNVSIPAWCDWELGVSEWYL